MSALPLKILPPDFDDRLHKRWKAHRQTLEEYQLRFSESRVRIIDLLTGASAVTPEEIYREFLSANWDVSLATVYRELRKMKNVGLVDISLDSYRKSRYFLTSKDSQEQIVCTVCGKVTSAPKQTVVDALQSLCTSYGIELEGYNLVLRGRCTDHKTTSSKSKTRKIIK